MPVNSEIFKNLQAFILWKSPEFLSDSVNGFLGIHVLEFSAPFHLKQWSEALWKLKKDRDNI